MLVSSGTGALECYVPRMLLWRGLDPTEQFAEMLDGTMVFADVSGFAKLSERLARTGKEGAEQLVDAINACFSALLGKAYARGASLLKFGGDAMLLWFEGEEHVVRACAAAAEMRRTLREVGRIRAGGGEVVLRMSVGVHSGSYAMFLVGGTHRELLIGGRGATTAVAMESLASAGQILVSADTASALPRGCLGAELGSGMLLARAPAPREWTPSDGVELPSDEAMARTLSTTVRVHVLEAHAPPERPTASIAFIQFRLNGHRHLSLDDLAQGEQHPLVVDPTARGAPATGEVGPACLAARLSAANGSSDLPLTENGSQVACSTRMPAWSNGKKCEASHRRCWPAAISRSRTLR